MSDVGQSVVGMAVHDGVWYPLLNSRHDLFAESFATRVEIVFLHVRQFERDAEPYNARHVLCARPSLAFLTAAGDERLDGGASPDVQRADPFGPVYLVPGQAQQVDSKAIHVERQFASRLYCVRVAKNACIQCGGLFPYEARYRAHVLYDADFVVGQHDANQQGLGTHCIRHFGWVHNPVAVGRHIGYVVPDSLQLLARVDNRMMFDSGGHDVAARMMNHPRSAFYRRVV